MPTRNAQSATDRAEPGRREVLARLGGAGSAATLGLAAGAPGASSLLRHRPGVPGVRGWGPARMLMRTRRGTRRSAPAARAETVERPPADGP
jgi:hypothetical protein